MSATGSTTGVTRTVRGPDDLSRSPDLVVHAATRTRAEWTVASWQGDAWQLARSERTGWLTATATSGQLVAELARLPLLLERNSGCVPPVPSRADTCAVPPYDGLAPGELLALADAVRHGDVALVEAACDELALPGVPPWVAELAWGASGLLWIRHAGERPAEGELLHLLACGWGRLEADADRGLTFRPMSSMQVQARLAAHAAQAGLGRG